MISLLAAALFFTAIHLGVSGTTLRDRLVARFGLRLYMVIFSIGSLAGMIWLAGAYNSAPYMPTWGMLEWWKPVMIIGMLPAFLLVIVGLTTPNPTAVGQEALASREPAGIVRITRHPFLMGVALWAALHLVGNGDVASLLFFAALVVVSLAGAVSIDAKRRRVLGSPAWDAFAGRTSILPFGAILAGRNRLSAEGFGWWRPAAGVLAFALMLGGHAHIVGVNPFPW